MTGSHEWDLSSSFSDGETSVLCQMTRGSMPDLSTLTLDLQPPERRERLTFWMGYLIFVTAGRTFLLLFDLGSGQGALISGILGLRSWLKGAELIDIEGSHACTVVSTDCFLGFGTFSSLMGPGCRLNHVLVTLNSLFVI